MSADQNREAWLTEAAKVMTGWFAEQDHEVPPFRLSVGWPGGRARKNTVRGQCWPTTTSTDNVAQIFISPVQVDTLTTLAVLLHEMIHVVDDCKSGHAKHFITVARSIGFKAKWTCSDFRTEELDARLAELATQLGEFPSAAITVGGLLAAAAGGDGGDKKQSTRMLKVVCVEAKSDPEGYKVRMTRKMIDTYGLPICPCHDADMEEVEVA